MKTHDAYINEKEEYSYKLFKRHRLFKKARAVILIDDKVVLIKHKDGGVIIPGGGVEDGETLRQAVVREAFEETGYKVEPIKILSKNFYIANLEHNGNKFTSKRVEYFYLCRAIKKVSDNYGIEGEFAGEIEIGLFDVDLLKRTKIKNEGIVKLKKFIEMNKEVNNG